MPAEPKSPRSVDLDLPDPLRVHRGIRPRDDVFGAEVTGLEGEADARHSRIAESVLDAESVTSIDLTGATLTDVAVTIGTTALPLRESRLRSVTLTGRRAGTIDALRSEWDGVHLQGLRIDYLSAASSEWSDVIFERCDIGSLDLPQARLHRVSFIDCRVDEVDTRETRCRDVDLRGLDAVRFTDPKGLSGATLSADQAVFHAQEFAVALGIRVR